MDDCCFHNSTNYGEDNNLSVPARLAFPWEVCAATGSEPCCYIYTAPAIFLSIFIIIFLSIFIIIFQVYIARRVVDCGQASNRLMIHICLSVVSRCLCLVYACQICAIIFETFFCAQLERPVAYLWGIGPCFLLAKNSFAPCMVYALKAREDFASYEILNTPLGTPFSMVSNIRYRYTTF